MLGVEEREKMDGLYDLDSYKQYTFISHKYTHTNSLY